MENLAGPGPVVGVSDHAGWAVLVTLGAAGPVVDRCKVVLKDDDLPGLPHHDASRRLPLAEAVTMVERVRRSARAHTEHCLAELAQRLDLERAVLALRAIPKMPDSVEECIADYWANARADGVMYREELARAAKARGWPVGWFDARQLAAVQKTADYAAREAEAAGRLAPPWNRDHRIALAGAMAVISAGGTGDGKA
tara:strand:+ start:112 stop:702 length:591 start_codon:yes stop_codon:yes gene_type:complete